MEQTVIKAKNQERITKSLIDKNTKVNEVRTASQERNVENSCILITNFSGLETAFSKKPSLSLAKEEVLRVKRAKKGRRHETSLFIALFVRVSRKDSKTIKHPRRKKVDDNRRSL